MDKVSFSYRSSFVPTGMNLWSKIINIIAMFCFYKHPMGKNSYFPCFLRIENSFCPSNMISKHKSFICELKFTEIIKNICLGINYYPNKSCRDISVVRTRFCILLYWKENWLSIRHDKIVHPTWLLESPLADHRWN